VSIAQFARRNLKGILERKGYWVRHMSVLPVGIDYQHDITRLSRAFGTEVNVFLDVGANTGQTSSAALATFPKASIFAFEPDKVTFAALTANLRNSRLQCFNLAMSNKRGEAQFFDYGPLATSNSLVANSHYALRSRNPATVRTVECDTIDSFCNRSLIDRIDVLKVDTEGHDLAVLGGATRMLDERRIQFIYIEFNTLLPTTGTAGGALMPIGELLEPAGFRFVASYPEYMITEGKFFVTQNALFTYVPE
jgi:FkbM family methyltransferase